MKSKFMLKWTNKPTNIINYYTNESRLGFKLPKSIEKKEADHVGSKSQLCRDLGKIRSLNQSNDYAIRIYDEKGRLLPYFTADDIQEFLNCHSE